jgi:hypothetical protein
MVESSLALFGRCTVFFENSGAVIPDIVGTLPMVN